MNGRMNVLVNTHISALMTMLKREDGQAGQPVSMMPLRLNRLLQLCSANLPVGGFSFSQGLEYATEQAWVSDPVSANSWISLNLSQGLAYTDLPILNRSYQALAQGKNTEVIYWDQHILACRESGELRFADVAMGKALIRLLVRLEGIDLNPYQSLIDLPEISFVSAFALAAYLWEIDQMSTLSGYCWTYIDSQVAAATKLIPLGQTQAQNLLFNLSQEVESAINRAINIADDEIGGSLPRLAMASAWHETQYTRLFRS